MNVLTAIAPLAELIAHRWYSSCAESLRTGRARVSSGLEQRSSSGIPGPFGIRDRVLAAGAVHNGPAAAVVAILAHPYSVLSRARPPDPHLVSEGR